MAVPKSVCYSDSYQSNYRYTLTEPAGQNFADGFEPELTPRQMLELGVFGGAYYAYKPQDLPDEWFKQAKLSADGMRRKELNFFKVNASQPLQVWQDKGWIHPQDPHGWFQWYCRYYLGRRSEDDERQIRRWKAYKRHIAQLVGNCAPRDFSCRPRQRQSLLHWAYDSRTV